MDIPPSYGNKTLGAKRMMVLITYDVNTADAAGKKRLRKIAKQCVIVNDKINFT